MKSAAPASTPRAKRLRLGIYGGTFDPIHLAHLIQARDALEQMKLDAVMFVPCGQSPFKERRPHITDAQRLALLRLALKSEPRFWLSRFELDRPPPSYAIETVAEIRKSHPKAKLFWLIGADQLPDLDRWHRIAELRKEVQFIVLQRTGPGENTEGGEVLSLPHPRRFDISATEIRRRVKARLPIDHFVPAPVAAYIQRHRLYLPR